MSIRGRLPKGLTLCALAATLAVSGCGKEVQEAIDLSRQEATVALGEAKAPKDKIAYNPVTVFDGVWLGDTGIRSRHGNPLPDHVEGYSHKGRAGSVVINTGGVPLELREIATEIAAQTGLPVEVAEEGPKLDDDSASSEDEDDVLRMPVRWDGPLSGLLEAVGSYFGIHWEYSDSVVKLFRYETRTFTLAALPTATTLSAGVNASGAASGSDTATTGGSSTSAPAGVAMTQEAKNELQLQVWDEVRDTIKMMIGDSGNVSLAPTSGILTVVAPPEAVDRVATYVDQANTLLTRQVAVTVKILQVSRSRDKDFGFSIQSVLSEINDKIALSGASPTLSVVDGAGTLSLLLRDEKSGALNGEREVIQALEANGDVSILTEAAVTTLNNRMVPVNVARQKGYLAGISTTLSGDTVTTELEAGMLTTGFTMHLLPRILSRERLMLQFGIGLSEMRALDEFASGGNSIQLPDLDVRSFIQQVVMRSGDTLVLAGYQKAEDQLGTNGTPGIGMVLGGNYSESAGKDIIVIMISPRIMTAGD